MAERRSIKQLKSYIKKLYTVDGYEVRAICAALNADRSERTIYNWIKKESWDALREELQKKSIKSPEILTKALEEQIEKLSEAGGPEAVAKIADSIAKITKTIKTLYRDRDPLGNILFTLADLGQFVVEYSKTKVLPEEFFTNFRTLLEAYQQHALRKYSPGIKP
jgi:transposase